MASTEPPIGTHAVLSQTAVALNNSLVGLWEWLPYGQLAPLATSFDWPVPAGGTEQLRAAFHRWNVDTAGARRWLGCDLDGNGRWCIARVRTSWPQPLSNAMPRRSRERTTLDIAGLCLGLMEAHDSANHLAEAQLVHGALHDPLTNLPNRAYFMERVAEAIERTRREADYRFAVLFLDIDHFKVVNDSLGHLAGDDLLVAIARRLEATTRPTDLVARLGGDEFTLLLEDVPDEREAELVARRVQRDLQASFSIAGHDVFATPSIGIALAGPAYSRPEELLRDADTAMYRAKARGRACYQVFRKAMHDGALLRLRLDTDLRRALERRECFLVYQPIIEVATRRIIALEALIRWAHPDRGVLLPEAFIPLAEETGLIVPLGRWVVREACAQARAWQEAFPRRDPIKVNVNLSARQFARPELATEVGAALEETGLDPRSLQVEITESVVMEHVETSIALLSRLRELNVQLHIDDFGTGYSSLSYLPQFPLNALKIDRSFIRRMGARRTDLEVVRTIIALAGNLGLDVIAEGVETLTQLERLEHLGCRFAQGFYLARPLDVRQLPELLAASECWGSM
jgi:diguanylate cyclase (GGDEF)-like protein